MSPIRKLVVSEEVYAAIKRSLFEGDWAPGERIDRKHLAERFGISQTPVNDALNRLTGEGLIDNRSRDGFFAPLYDDTELADLFAARAGLESIAARLCAEGATEAEKRTLAAIFSGFGDTIKPGSEAAYLAADKRFHKLVLEISGSIRLNEVEATFGIAGRSYEHGLVRSPGDTLADHRAIVDAILAGDGRAAQLAMAEHLLTTRSNLLASAGEKAGG